jgi:PadR family transcriptional regulator AphA
MDVRLLCLGMLTRGDASGYAIKKRFEGPMRQFFDASFGSIYPALSRLAAEELVICTAQAQAGRPDKKVYRITAKGRLAFVDALMKPPAADRFRSELMATLLFSDLLPARHLAALLDQRIADHRAQLAELDAVDREQAPAGERFVRGLGVTLFRAALHYIEENRHLVEGEALLSNGANPAIGPMAVR